jgi:hypothetical protein
MLDTLAYYARYVAIYLIFGLTMGLSSIEKLTGPVPDWFSDQFESTWVASFPGLGVAWLMAGVLEIAVALLCVVSIVTLEVLPSRRKPFLKLALGIAAITFMMLAIGQRITFQFDGAASLFFYFGATMATLLVVFRDEAHDDAVDAREAAAAR